MPKVSVLMAVRDGMPYLPEAIESILEQSFTDFEFLAIDDASTDGSTRILQDVSDPRFKLIVNKKHLGLSRSLNKGISKVKGKYIARMDHDDVSLADRLAKQVAYLEEHSQVDVLGTWAKTLGLSPEQTWRYPAKDADIRAEMIFSSVLVHSSVMLRRSTFQNYKLRYDPNSQIAQYYEFLTRIAARVRFANLEEVLLRYRIHKLQVGKRRGDQQQAVAAKVRVRELIMLDVHPRRKERELHNAIRRWEIPTTRTGFMQMERWFLILSNANQREQRYSHPSFRRTLDRRWWAACRNALSLGSKSWELYRESPVADIGSHSFFQKRIFQAKALFRD